MKREIIKIAFLILSLAIIFSGCDLFITYYQVFPSTAGNGAILIEPQLDKYQANTEILISAVPEENWVFSHWEGDLSGSENPISVIIKEDLDVKAVFVEELTLEINIIGGGEVSKDPHQLKYQYGDNVTITAEADSGFVFSHYQGDRTSTENPLHLVMDDNLVIEAVFLEKFEIETLVEGAGEIELSPDLEKYVANTEITVSAIAEKGWSFIQWQGDLSGTINPYSFTIEDNMSIKAVFELFGGGDGSENNPFLIKTAEHLSQIREFPDYHFQQIADIDLSSSAYAENWPSIGVYYDENNEQNVAFSGVYDGADYQIQGLKIQQENQDFLGLFAFIDEAIIKNINLVDVELSGNSYIGSLIGFSQNSVISNVLVQGNIAGNSFRVGGVIGSARNSYIDGVDSNVTVTSTGNFVGGLIGYSRESTLKNSFVTGSVVGFSRVGGLVGDQGWHGLVENCGSEANVTGNNRVGGLIGKNNWHAVIKNSYADSEVEGYEFVGGLVGYLLDDSSIFSSYAAGNVWGKDSHIGGLVGDVRFNCLIEDSYATGFVNSTGSGLMTGGLLGSSAYSVIRNSYALGNVSAENSWVGGLIGSADYNETINCYALGDVLAEGSYVGGLIGVNNNTSTIIDSFYQGFVAGGFEAIGGLVGYLGGAFIENSYAEATVTGVTRYVGGLVGRSWYGNINNSFAGGTIIGSTDVGGLVGWHGNSETYNSYALGSVKGDSRVGGLMGRSSLRIFGSESTAIDSKLILTTKPLDDVTIVKYCYAAVSVQGSASTGGLIGENTAEVSDSYYDQEVANKNDLNKGIPKTTAEMMTKATYEAWDFLTIWSIDEGESYPYFYWQ